MKRLTGAAGRADSRHRPAPKLPVPAGYVLSVNADSVLLPIRRDFFDVVDPFSRLLADSSQSLHFILPTLFMQSSVVVWL